MLNAPARCHRYILSSAVLTLPGAYTYQLLSVETARAWLARDDFVSAIGYDITAEAASMLLCTPIRAQRQHIAMEPGDEALVFRLRMRTRPGMHLSPDFVARNAEIGLLQRSVP